MIPAMSKLVVLMFLPLISLAGPTKVGNGDDGADLEKLQKVESGILISTRDKALTHLNNLNVRAVSGLGTLPDELRLADIYIVQNDIAHPKKFDAGMEVSPDGQTVYARTLAQPYSPVRFFPSSLTLSEEQLIRLHIHEALHRALPPSIREDESVVSEITLAITSPTASRDSLETTMAKYMAKHTSQPDSDRSAPTLVAAAPRLEPSARLLNPSIFKLSYQTFDLNSEDKDVYPLNSLYRLDSFMYPFGSDTNSLGIGITISYLSYGDQHYMGPLQVSARQLLNTWRGFDVEGFAEYSMYSMTDKEMQNVSQSRDVATLGVSLKKETDIFYTENFISIALGSEKEFTIGNAKYTQDYAPIINTRIGAGYKFNRFYLGGVFEISVTDSPVIKSSSGSFETTQERISLFTAGPEFGYAAHNMQWSLYARTVLQRHSDYNLSTLGNVLNQGAGQGLIGTSVSFNY